MDVVTRPRRANVALAGVLEERAEEQAMRHKNKQCLNVVLAELEAAHIPYTVECGKHTKMRFMLNGRPSMAVISVTTRNWDQHRNARANIRRMLRQAKSASEGARS
jgi:hypothetical protein